MSHVAPAYQDCIAVFSFGGPAVMHFTPAQGAPKAGPNPVEGTSWSEHTLNAKGSDVGIGAGREGAGGRSIKVRSE